MKKIFTCFVALLAIAAAATGPARAQSNTVMWYNFQMSELNLSSQGDRQTTNNVTITSNGGSAGNNTGSIYLNGAFTFSVPADFVFTQIVIVNDGNWLGLDVNNTGWSLNEHQTEATWTGSARSVACQINASNVQSIEFTIALAVPKMYTSDVSITDLVPGDTLAEGATITGRGNSNDMVYLNFGRFKENGVIPAFWQNLNLPPTVIGTNGTISGTYTPVDGNGQDGNAWLVMDAVVSDYDGFEVGLGGIFIPVYRKLDSIPADWTVKVEGVTQTLQTYDGGNTQMRWLEINQTDSVTLIPDNPRRVKSVTLEDAESTPSMLATPLTLEALTDGNIKVYYPKSGMQYSKNGAEKVAMTSTTTIDVVAGDKVAFYGNGTSIVRYGEKTGSASTRFYGGSAQVKAYGNIMSLVDEENFATATTLPSNRTFAYLFNNNSGLIDASSLVLPATTMTDSCYWNMFGGCTYMTAAPEVLPAMTLAKACYWKMFNSCSNLTTAPLLPATTLVEKCYSEMFSYCYKLSSVTCLATNIEESNNFLNNWLESAGSDLSVTTRTLYVDPSLVSSAFWANTNFTVTAIQ